MKKNFNNLYKILLKFFKKNNILVILFLILVIVCIIYYNYSNNTKEGFETDILVDVKYKSDNNQDKIIVKHLIPDNIANFDKLDENRVKIAIKKGSYERIFINHLRNTSKTILEKTVLFNLLPYGYFHNNYLKQYELDLLYTIDLIYYDLSNQINIIKFSNDCEVDIYDTNVRGESKMKGVMDYDEFTIRQNAYNVFLKCDKDSKNVLVDNITFNELSNQHNITKNNSGFYVPNDEFNKISQCRLQGLAEGIDACKDYDIKWYSDNTSPYTLNYDGRFKTLYINNNDIIKDGELVYTPQKQEQQQEIGDINNNNIIKDGELVYTPQEQQQQQDIGDININITTTKPTN